MMTLSNVLADDTVTIRKHWLSGAYGVYVGADRTRLFKAESYSFDSQIAYCIEPGTAITSDSYTVTDNLDAAGINKELLDKIRLIAYYGFSYNNGPNKNDRYYMASQELIWEEISGRDTYWVYDEDLNGTRINVDREKNEITSMINKHYTLPSFNNETITVKVGETYILKDDANVLNKFTLDTTQPNVKIIDNRLEITPESLNDAKVLTLTSKSYTDKVPYIFYSGTSQKMISTTGKVEPLKATVKLNIVAYPQIKIVKIDAKTNKKIKIAGIKFKIKNLDTNSYVCENTACIYETNESGEIITNSKLPYGNYQIEELNQDIKGYQVNTEPLKFVIDENSHYQETDNMIYLELKFKNTPVLGEIIINKLGEVYEYKDNLISYSFTPLDEVTFNIYAQNDIYNPSNELKYHKDELVESVTTSGGQAKVIDLPLGKYYLLEVEAPNNYLIDNTKYEFDITKDSNHKTITINNYLPKGIFKLKKVDNKVNKPLAEAEITLYSEDDELIMVGKTDDNGELIINNLPLGRYYYIETKAPEGYQIDTSKNYFELTENNQEFNANFINEIIPVPDTNLNKNYTINILSIFGFIIGAILFVFGKN